MVGSSTLKMATRFSFLLLIAVLLILTFVSAQNSAFTTRSTPSEEGSAVLQKAPAPFHDFGSSWTNDKTNQWKIHLALRMVKHPKLNEQQMRFILDTISSSGSEFVTDFDDTFQQFRQRALGVFSKEESAEIFSDIADGKILRMYHALSSLPIKEAKASFRSASANDKSDLWRTHLSLFLVKRPELDESQKKIIWAAMALATPEFFKMQSSDPGWKARVQGPLRSLEEQVVSAFS